MIHCKEGKEINSVHGINGEEERITISYLLIGS